MTDPLTVTELDVLDPEITAMRVYVTFIGWTDEDPTRIRPEKFANHPEEVGK